jgi:hypothetical protein
MYPCRRQAAAARCPVTPTQNRVIARPALLKDAKLLVLNLIYYCESVAKFTDDFLATRSSTYPTTLAPADCGCWSSANMIAPLKKERSSVSIQFTIDFICSKYT